MPCRKAPRRPRKFAAMAAPRRRAGHPSTAKAPQRTIRRFVSGDRRAFFLICGYLPNKFCTRRQCNLSFVFKVFVGALGEIRTPDPQIRSLMLYPAELRARAKDRDTDAH